LLHAARGVLLNLADDADMRAAARPWSDRVDIVTASAHPAGGQTPLAGADAVLVRPDGYCAWIGSGPSGPQELPAALARWFGQPRQQPVAPSIP
jgi:bifunctional hydroxylase/dehydrase